MKIKISLTILLLSLFFLNFASANLTDDLYVYYNLDESSGSIAIDSLNVTNATNDGATIGVQGIIGTAYYFNGSGSNLNLTSGNLPYSFYNNSFSISVWLNSSVYNAGDYIWWGGTADTALSVFNSSHLVFSMFNGSNNNVYSPIPSLNQWGNIITTRNDTGMYIYLNGVLQDSLLVNPIPNVPASDKETLIGLRHSQPSNSYEGILDEVGFWNRSLNSTEILALYNSGNGNTYPFSKIITLHNPTNTQTLAKNIITFNSSVTTNSVSITVLNMSLYTNETGTFEVRNSTAGIGTSTHTQTWNRTIGTGTYLWNVNVCFSDSTCSFSPQNYTFTLSNFTEINQTFDSEIFEGFLQNITLDFNAINTLLVSSATLDYNGTNYSASIINNGDFYSVSRSFYTPQVSQDENITFQWFIGLSNGQIFPSSVQNQSIKNIAFDDCASNPYVILNLSLFNERTLASINGDIELNLDLINPTGETIASFSTSKSNVSSQNFCSEINLNETNNFYDLQIRYYSSNDSGLTYEFVPEFYHIQNSSTSTFPQTINLYDLDVNESTEFNLIYRNNNYVAEEGVLLQILRKYIDEGIYRTVEIPITSGEGTTIGHFDTNNYQYRIIATKGGIVQNIFDNPSVACQSELSGICEIILNGRSSPSTYETVESIEDFTYSLSLDNSTISFEYSIPSGSTNNITVVMVQTSPFANPITICSQTFISSSSSIECDVNSTIGDSKVTITIFKNGIVFGQFYVDFQENLNDSWFLNNYIIAALLLIILVTMFISSPQLMIVSSVFGVIYLAFVFLLKSYSIGVVIGAIVWLIFSAIIVIYKLNLKEET